MDPSFRQADLFKIVEAYFRQKNDVEFSTNVEMQGKSRKWKVDAIVKNADGVKYGLLIKDWDRTLGINQIRQIQKCCYDIPLDGAVVVTNSFSPSALSYAKRFGISCYSRYEILAKI
jgi:hypothetical protein